MRITAYKRPAQDVHSCSPKGQLQLFVPARVWSISCGCLKYCALERNLHKWPHLYLCYTHTHKKKVRSCKSHWSLLYDKGEVCCTWLRYQSLPWMTPWEDGPGLLKWETFRQFVRSKENFLSLFNNVVHDWWFSLALWPTDGDVVGPDDVNQQLDVSIRQILSRHLLSFFPLRFQWSLGFSQLEQVNS